MSHLRKNESRVLPLGYNYNNPFYPVSGQPTKEIKIQQFIAEMRKKIFKIQRFSIHTSSIKSVLRSRSCYKSAQHAKALIVDFSTSHVYIRTGLARFYPKKMTLYFPYEDLKGLKEVTKSFSKLRFMNNIDQLTLFWSPMESKIRNEDYRCFERILKLAHNANGLYANHGILDSNAKNADNNDEGNFERAILA